MRISDWSSDVCSSDLRAVVGKPEAYDLLRAAGATPRENVLAKMETAPFHLPAGDIATTLADAKTYLRFPLEKGEQIYGFGLNFKTVNQRGRILRLHVDQYGYGENGRTNAPQPSYDY